MLPRYPRHHGIGGVASPSHCPAKAPRPCPGLFCARVPVGGLVELGLCRACVCCLGRGCWPAPAWCSCAAACAGGAGCCSCWCPGSRLLCSCALQGVRWWSACLGALLLCGAQRGAAGFISRSSFWRAGMAPRGIAGPVFSVTYSAAGCALGGGISPPGLPCSCALPYLAVLWSAAVPAAGAVGLPRCWHCWQPAPHCWVGGGPVVLLCTPPGLCPLAGGHAAVPAAGARSGGAGHAAAGVLGGWPCLSCWLASPSCRTSACFGGPGCCS